MKTITLLSLLFITINCRGVVYMCHDDPFKDEQCMKRETLGKNTFYWVRKCKGAKVCVNLPYYGNIIGACSIKVRSHYDGESCANGNKCTSGICDGTKCKGLNPNIECQPGLGQCKKGYLCRRSAKADGTATGIYTCQKPLGANANCNSFTTSNIDFQNPIFSSRYFDPSNNPCELGYVCATITKKDDNENILSPTTTCVEIASQKVSDSKLVSVDNPLACDTGYILSGNCAKAEDNASPNSLNNDNTAKGGTFTKFSNITMYFEKWREEWGKKNIKEEDAIYEAYRYTKNKKKINEAFFKYTHAAWISDADECAYDYMWKQNSSNSLKFSLMILVLALLF